MRADLSPRRVPSVLCHSAPPLPELSPRRMLRPDVPEGDTHTHTGLVTPLSPSPPQDVATLQFCANKLDKKDFFGKSDPFMVFYRSNEDGT